MNINHLTFLVALFIWHSLDAQSPELVVQRGHIAPVTDVVISDKYNFIITASYDKSIKIWHKTSGLEIRSLDNFMKGFSEIKMDISANERYIFAAAANGSLEKIDLEDGSQEVIQEPNGVFITAVAIRPKSSQIAIGYENGNVELLDYKTKTTIKNWKLSMQFIKKIEFSSNGKLIFANSDDNKFLAHDIKKSKDVTNFPESVSAFDVSPKGKEIAIAQPDKTFSIFKTKNGKQVETRQLNQPTQFVGYADDAAIVIMNSKFQISKLNAKTFKLSPILLPLPRFFVFKTLEEGNFVFNEGPVTKIYNLNNLTTPKEYKGYDGNVYASSVHAALFDKEVRNIVSGGGEQTIQFWGEVNNEQLPVGFEINKIKANVKGTQMVVAGNSKDFHLVDMGLLEIEKTFTGHKKGLLDIGFVEDNIISVGKDKTVKVWSKDGKIIHDWTDHKGYVYSLSTFENMAVTGDSKGQIYIWDISTGEQLDKMQRAGHIVQQLEFGDDGSIIYIGFDDGKVWAWDWELGEVDWKFQPYSTPVSVLEFYDNKLYVASGIADSKLGASISIYNVVKEKLEGVLAGHNSGINDLQISPDGKYLVSAANDNLVKLWHVESQKLLATQYTLGSGDWAIVTPSGLFDASQGGMKLMHYVHKNEAIQLNQLKERYYEPDLLQKLLGYNAEPIRNVEGFDNVALYPDAKLDLVNNVLFIDLVERSGGIGKVSVFINQKEVIEDANSNRMNALKIDLRDFKRYLIEGEVNQIGVKVFNKTGWMHSDMINVDYKPTSAATRRNPIRKKYEPKFYALVVGTSNYRGERLDLTYADKDAEAIANALELTSKELFGIQKTEVELLTTAQADDGKPSKKNIAKTFSDLAQKIKPEDVFLLYLSGHGVNYGSPNSQFYYLTQEIASEDLGDEAIRNNFTISSSEFTQFLKTIPAQKQIMIIDACSSGSLVENVLSQSRSLSSSQKRALERMKDRTGVFILAGSAANKVSYEASQFGQGLLTYSLLSGMRGGSLRENQYVDVMQLFQFAADKVPELAAVIGGVQRPVVATPSSTNSFDFGQVTDSVRYKIPLAQVKPLFIRSNFQHETEYEDILDLSDKLDETFVDISDDADASIIFINVKKYPKAYSIKGRYSINDNGSILLSAKMIKDKTTIGTIEVYGKDEQELIDNLLDEVIELLPNQ